MSDPSGGPAAEPPQFDDYSDDYEGCVSRAVGVSRETHAVLMRIKAERLLALVEETLGDPGEVRGLDLGCGTGSLHPHLAPHLRSLVGVDPSIGSIARVPERGVASRPVGFDGRRLPFAARSFDLVVAQCVLHHVVPVERPPLLVDAVRTLRPGGILAVIEHNPNNPLTLRAVSRCEFDRDAELLRLPAARRLLAGVGLAPVTADYFLFTPWRAPWLRRLETAIAWLPLGAQYLVAGRVQAGDMPSSGPDGRTDG